MFGALSPSRSPACPAVCLSRLCPAPAWTLSAGPLPSCWARGRGRPGLVLSLSHIFLVLAFFSLAHQGAVRLSPQLLSCGAVPLLVPSGQLLRQGGGEPEVGHREHGAGAASQLLPQLRLGEGHLEPQGAPGLSEVGGRRTVLGAASAASRSTRAWWARAAAPTGSSPISSRPAFLAKPRRWRMGSWGIAGHLLHLLLQALIDLWRDRLGESPLQSLGLSCPGQTHAVRAQIRPAAGSFPRKSREMAPSGDLTTRISSFFGLISRQPTHWRIGSFLGTVRTTLRRIRN